MDIKILFNTNKFGKRDYVIKLAITPIDLGKRLIITVKLVVPPIDTKLLFSPSTNDLTNIDFFAGNVSTRLTNTELNIDELIEKGYIQRIVRDRDVKRVLSNIFNLILIYKKDNIWELFSTGGDPKERLELLNSILSSVFVFEGKYYSPSFIANPSNPCGGTLKITDYEWVF